MAGSGREIRTVIDHLVLIKAHLLSLEAVLERLGTAAYSPAGIVELRRGSLDVRMVVEELMLLSVAAHERSGQELADAIRTTYRADKKMRLLEQLNPNFFPDAIDLVPADQPGLAGRFVDVQEEYLTASAARSFYHQSDNMLHASWGYLGTSDFSTEVERLSTFSRLAARLLRNFEVDISGTGFMVLGHIHLDSDLAPVAFDARTTGAGGIPAA